MAIQLFVPTFDVEECLNEIRECLEKGWTGIGFKTVQFEEKWKEYTGYENAHFLNSATSGLHLAIKILKIKYGWKDGDVILSQALTFVSTNHAVLYENLHVSFVDTDEHLCLDPIDLENKITENTKAVIFVGLGGNTGQYQKVVELCKKYNLKLILDAAHMSGTELYGKKNFDCDVAVYSFQAVKNLPTADSGMICFKEKEDDAMARKLSWLGINKDTFNRSNDGNYKFLYDVENVGFKYHGNSIIASIGLAQLKKLDRDNDRRRNISNLYENSFVNNKNIELIPIPEGCVCSRHLYIIKTNNRNGLIDYLNKNQVFPGVHYVENTQYSMYKYDKGKCPNSERNSGRIISLPMHLRLTDEDVLLVSSLVNEFTK